MNELLRRARAIRCDIPDQRVAFCHRLRVGFVVAALILILSNLG